MNIRLPQLRRVISFLTSLALLAASAPCRAAEEPVLRFACISDVHLDDVLIQGSHDNMTQCRAALAAGVAAGYGELLIVGGDISSYGNTKYWTTLKNMAAEAGYARTEWALGNHEYGTVFENPDGDEDFLAFTGLDSLWYTKTIGGFRFLFLAAEGAEIMGNIGSEQAEWFRTELAAAVEDAQGKPVFVISHYNTSHAGADKLEQYLAQHDNVFLLWGHSHSESWETYPMSGYVHTEKRYTSARMGSVQYGTSNAADIMLVDVYERRVDFRLLRTDGAEVSPNTASIRLCAGGKLSVVGNDTPLLQLTAEQPCDAVYCAFYDKYGRMRSAVTLPALQESGYRRSSVTLPKNAAALRVYRTAGGAPVGEAKEIRVN